MADKLIRRPTDLTQLSRMNSGSFPETMVYRIVDGRDVVLFHGPREMPIWGDRFSAVENEIVVDARISSLVGYLEGMQGN